MSTQLIRRCSCVLACIICMILLIIHCRWTIFENLAILPCLQVLENLFRCAPSSGAALAMVWRDIFFIHWKIWQHRAEEAFVGSCIYLNILLHLFIFLSIYWYLSCRHIFLYRQFYLFWSWTTFGSCGKCKKCKLYRNNK